MLYMKWLIEDSTIYEDEGSIPALKNGDLLDALADFEGVELLADNLAKDGEESLFNEINSESEVGINNDDYPDCEILEAALYGSNTLHQFRYIILPSIKSIVVLNLILSISGSLSAFKPPYVITNGTMGTGTYFVIMNRLAHENQKVGLACAMAVVLLGIIVICTVAQKLFFKYAFDDGTSDESKATVRRRKKAEKAARKAMKGGQA